MKIHFSLYASFGLFYSTEEKGNSLGSRYAIKDSGCLRFLIESSIG